MAWTPPSTDKTVNMGQSEPTTGGWRPSEKDLTYQEPDVMKELSEGYYRQKAYADKIIAVNETVNKLSFSDGYNDDEKDHLKELAIRYPDMSYDTWNEAVKVMGGNSAVQGGYQTYYMSDHGIPTPLAPGQKVPKQKEIASVWGSQESANDDDVFTTIGKNLANTIPNVIKSMESIPALVQTMATGKEPEWYKASLNRLKTLKGVASEESQAELFDTKDLEMTWDSIMDPSRFNFNPKNVAGSVSNLVSSIAEYAFVNIITGGLGAKVKAAKQGFDYALKAKQLLAGVMVNMGETLDMAEEAGLKDREKFAFGSLVALPVSLIEQNLGLGSKILNAGQKTAKTGILKEASKLIERDAFGNITKKSLGKAYKATTTGIAEWGLNVMKSGIPEASEEMLQGTTQAVGAKVFDQLFGEDRQVGEGKFGTEPFSAEQFGNRINEGLAGFMGGAGGNIRGKANNQSKAVYEAIEEGPSKVKELKLQLSAALKSKDITQEEHDAGIFKINAYEKYHSEVAGLKVSNKTKRRISDLVWTNENLNTQIVELEKNPDSKLPGSNANTDLDVHREMLNDNINELKQLKLKPITDQQTAVSKKTEEKIKKAETPLNIVVGKKKEEPPTLEQQIKGATTVKDIDAFIKQADAEGTMTPELMDIALVQKAKIPPIKSALEQEYDYDMASLPKEIEAKRLEIKKVTDELSTLNVKVDEDIPADKLEEEDEWMQDQMAKDPNFKNWINTHNDIAYGQNSSLNPSMRQKEAVGNLYQQGFLTEDESKQTEGDRGSLSELITLGIRRSQWMKDKAETKGDTETVAKINKYQDGLKKLLGMGKGLKELEPAYKLIANTNNLSEDVRFEKLSKIKERLESKKKPTADDIRTLKAVKNALKLAEEKGYKKPVKQVKVAEPTKVEPVVVEPVIEVKTEEPIEPTKKKRKKKYIPIEQSDEVKDIPVFEGKVNKLFKKLANRKAKSPMKGTVFFKDGSQTKDLPSIETGNQTYEMASRRLMVEALKQQGMIDKDVENASITLKHVKKEDWNADDKLVDKLGKPYGDKIVVIAKNKKGEDFELGTLKVTDYEAQKKVIAEKRKVEKSKPKELSKSFTEEKPVSEMTNEEIVKSKEFIIFKSEKGNSKLSEQKVLEYYKNCKG
jgi:hypothetical protein